MALALANWGTKEFKGTFVMLDDYLPGFGDYITGEGSPKQNDGWMIP